MANSLIDGLNKPDYVEVTSNSTVYNTADASAIIQAGSVEPVGAAAMQVVFPTAFASAPSVTITVAESGAAHGSITNCSAGSFGFLGTSGILYNWIAVQ